MVKKNLVGQQFGRLYAVKFAYIDNHRDSCWWCECDCGEWIIVKGYNLKSGNTKSCGCLHREKISEASTKHGLFKNGQKETRLYRVWIDMRQRCNNPNIKCHKNYFDKGIKIYKEWNDFPTFETWAILHGYTDKLTIDRINSDLGYYPDNVQFITKAENSRKSGKIKKKGDK